ncbi:hypothetical protein D3C78_1609000 [compost metagenome]
MQQRGFSRQDFTAALGELETVPDYFDYLNDWLSQLQSEGMSFMVVTSMRAHATRAVREQLTGTSQSAVQSINEFCDTWLDSNTPGSFLRPYLEAALPALKESFSGFRDEELLARFLMRAIKKCVDPS